MIINEANHINNNQFISLEKKKALKKRTFYEHNLVSNKSIEYNNRPAQAISFGGSAISSGQGFAKKFLTSSWINKTMGFVYDNEAAYNAIYSLVIAGVLKPLCVLNMPGSEDKDKQMVATKNFLQAFIGSFLGYTIGGGIVKKSVDVIENNLKLIKFDENKKLSLVDLEKAKKVAKEALKKDYDKNQKSITSQFNYAKEQSRAKEGFSKVPAFFKHLFEKRTIAPFDADKALIEDKAKELLANAQKHLPVFEKNTSFIEELLENPQTKSLFKQADTGQSLMDAYKTCWKNSTGFITAIAKAKISSLLLPGVMAVLFAKRNLEKAESQKAEKAAQEGLTLTTTRSFNNEKEKFNAIFAPKKALAFTGVKPSITDNIINNLAKGVETISMSKAGEKGTKFLSKFRKQSARMADLESILLTGYWVQNTVRSKKIDPEQKLGFNINTVLVTVVSSSLALLIDTLLDGPITGLKNVYQKMLEEAVKSGDLSSLDKLMNSKKFISQIKNQNQVSQLSETIVKNPNATGEEIANTAKTIFGDIDPSELNKGIADSKLLSDITTNVSQMGKDGKSADAIKEFLSDNNIKIAKEDLQEVLKSADDVSILKKLSNAINKDTIEQTTSLYHKQLSKFKSLTIFTLVVRFLVPVLMVPISGTIKKKVLEATKNKKSQQEKNEVKA